MAALDWNLKLVRAREALALLPRKPNSDDEIDWKEVEIAHIDTGCTLHRVFGPWDGDQSPILRPRDGLNLIEPNEAPFDPLDHDGFPGHGTRTASVLCGNLPGQFVGVAPGVPTIPYRAVNSTVLWTKKARNRVARCVRHAVEINACEIVSMSMGFPQMSLFGQRRLGQAVDYAYEEGIILVAAGGQVIDRVTYPGRFSRTIGVGGISPDQEVWFKYEQSSATDSIDVWAPSDLIYRANSILNVGQPIQDDYGTGDGTSYGTVHVAAAAAMWLACRDAEIEEQYDEPWQRIEAFRLLLANTSQPVRGEYWPDGDKGILNIEDLLNAELPDPEDLTYEKRKAEKQIF